MNKLVFIVGVFGFLLSCSARPEAEPSSTPAALSSYLSELAFFNHALPDGVCREETTNVAGRQTTSTTCIQGDIGILIVSVPPNGDSPELLRVRGEYYGDHNQEDELRFFNLFDRYLTGEFSELACEPGIGGRLRRGPKSAFCGTTASASYYIDVAVQLGESRDD